MGGGCFDNDAAGRVDDPMGEGKADSFDTRQPDLDSQQVVIACGAFVTEAAFNDREEGVALLPAQKRLANVPEELAARCLQEVKIAAVVDVVARSTFRIDDTMLMAKNMAGHAGNLQGQGGEGKNGVLE